MLGYVLTFIVGMMIGGPIGYLTAALAAAAKSDANECIDSRIIADDEKKDS